MDELTTLIERLVSEQSLLLATLSAPRQKTAETIRQVTVRPLLLRGKPHYQFEALQEKKALHHNYAPAEAATQLKAMMGPQFQQARLCTQKADYKVTIRDRQPVIETLPPSRPALVLSHDREKAYLLPEGEPHDFLVRLGVMTKEGRVVAARYDKFRQINRFLEMVRDVQDALPPDQPLHIIDFGCGKSYLTFALYYYLTTRLSRQVEIMGLDLKRDVVSHCNTIAQDLGYAGLRFETGQIADFTGIDGVDMVVSLHACDTATDDALAKAIQWEAQVILAVPCCQHELFKQLQNEALQAMLQHGIIRERLTGLVTDSLRAALLEAEGYTVQMLEFIDMAHTPKNILLRAVRKQSNPDRARLLREYEVLRDFWHATPALERNLGRKEV